MCICFRRLEVTLVICCQNIFCQAKIKLSSSVIHSDLSEFLVFLCDTRNSTYKSSPSIPKHPTKILSATTWNYEANGQNVRTHVSGQQYPPRPYHSCSCHLRSTVGTSFFHATIFLIKYLLSFLTWYYCCDWNYLCKIYRTCISCQLRIYDIHCCTNQIDTSHVRVTVTIDGNYRVITVISSW